MAQGLLQKLLEQKGRSDVQVLSAGIGTLGGLGATEETIEVMRKEGINVSAHMGQPLTPELVRHADAIFCMEQFHRDEILSRVPGATQKVYLLKLFRAPYRVLDPNIADPIGLPMEVYESCFMTIKEAVERVAQWLETEPEKSERPEEKR